MKMWHITWGSLLKDEMESHGDAFGDAIAFDSHASEFGVMMSFDNMCAARVEEVPSVDGSKVWTANRVYIAVYSDPRGGWASAERDAPGPMIAGTKDDNT